MESLAKIQQTLNVPKDQWNQFGEYKYRNIEDILEAVKPLMGKAVLLFSDEVVLIGDRYYVKATATFKEGGDSVSVSAYAREALTRKKLDEPQLTGVSSSYARKYAVGALFCLSHGLDPDTMNNSNGGGSPTPSSNDVASPKAAPSPSPVQEEIGDHYDQVATTPKNAPQNRPVCSKVEKDFMNALVDYFKKEETAHFKLSKNKLADVVWEKLGHWAATKENCSFIKQYVSFVDVAEKVQ